MHIDYDAWRFWLSLAQAVATALIGIYVWLSNREKVTAGKFEALARDLRAGINNLEEKTGNRIGRIDHRLTVVESSCNHAITHTDLSAVYERINAVSGQLSNLAGGVSALQNSMTMIHEHLLREKGA